MPENMNYCNTWKKMIVPKYCNPKMNTLAKDRRLNSTYEQECIFVLHLFNV